MAEIDGGSLSFKSVMDNDQLNSAIDETLRRVQGFSDAVVGSGDVMDKTTQEMIVQVRSALGKIGDACVEHEQALDRLGQEYDRLGNEMERAFTSGRDDEFRALQEKRNAIQGEMTVRKQLLKELREQSNALEAEATKMEQSAAVANNTAQSHVSLRSRIRELREEMALYREQFGDQTDKYREMAAELGRLQDIQGDIQTQGKILSNDEAQFQGIISGLNGVVGGFTAAQGAVALFAGENENLQKIMLKVQSLMSITMGLQQVSQALNKDSAFRLATINGLKEWWNKLTAIGRGEQIASTAAKVADTTATNASTVAITANTAARTAANSARTASIGVSTKAAAAQGVQTASAVAGTAANIGLAGAFRMVGAAIKSIPVFGWILAGISALIALVSHFVGKAKEAKKAQEEWYKSIAENSYKPIATIMDLSQRWNELGNDLEAKKKFIEENKKAFDELGLAINDVVDAENILSNPAQVQKFVDAQIEKAKAMILIQQAQEKVKTLIQKEQEYKAMPKTKNVYVQTSSGTFGTSGYYVEVINTARDELGAEIEALKEEITNGFVDAAKAETNGFNLLKQAGIDATKTYADGTLGAIEQAIQVKQAALKKLTNNTDYEAALKEIADLQKQADAITGKKSGGGGGGTPKDPFLEKLAKYKSEYARFQKWVNSGDAIIQKAAATEFDGLLKQGATYIDYLKRQRDIILEVDVANRTKAQNKQLRQLNDAIAEETKQTVLDAFNAELNEQLTNAKTTLEMLKIIEQKRKELSGDGTEMDNAKGEALDDAEKNAKEQLAEETEALLAEYASYAEKKRRIDEAYNRDYEILMEKRKATTDEAQLAEIDAAIANRKKQRDDDVNNIGGIDYDALLAEYGTFEQRKQAIIDGYEEKRRIAREQGNEDMLNALNEAQAKAISALATSELTDSESWTNLFSNLDELTASKIETLIQEIESNFEELSGVFNPIDLQQVREKLNEARMVLMQDNPFKQLGASLKAIFKDAGDDSKDSTDQIKKNWKKLGESTEASFQFVMDAVNSCDFLKDAIGDVGSTAISSMASVVATSIAVATAIKTAEKSSVILAIIQAALVVVQAVVNVVKSIVGNQDAKLEKQIEKWKGAVDDLKNAYAQLSWEIDKALGGQVYKTQQAAIKNMQQQQAYLENMWKAEQNKKKADSDKVRDYKEQYAELERQIADMYEEIANDIVQTDAKGFAEELGDALAEAFEKGEDASKAFEETVNDVLKNAIINQLKKNFLEQQLQGALDQLEGSMGYWNGDEFIFDGLTDAEIAAFKAKVQAAANNYEQALGIYSDLFKDLNIEESDDSLTGAVKGVSEETASIIAGQMNAVRINQLETTSILRQQLQTLNTIAANTAYNRYLAKIERIITILENNSGDSLRSQGLS